MVNPNKVRFCGIDQSLVHTSVATLFEGSDEPGFSWLIPPKGLDRGVHRLAFFMEAFETLFRNAPFQLVAMEGYSMGSKGNTFNLGELCGLVRIAAFRAKQPLIVVPPNSLKLFVTGKGNSPKDVMVKSVYKLWDVDVDNNN